MALDPSIFQQYQPTPIQSPQNALMQGLQMQRARQQNALMQMQMEAAQQEQVQRAQQMAAQQQMQQRRASYLDSISPSAGPAQAFDPARAILSGVAPQEIEAIRKANMQPRRNVAPGGAVFNDATGQVEYQAPFKEPAPPALPAIAQLQQYRESLPANDPRRREVQALIDNQTRPPKYATGGTAAPKADSGAMGMPMGERPALAAQLGVPVADRDPIPPNMPAAQAAIFSRTLYTNADKKLNEFAESASSAKAMAQDAQRFLELQKNVQMQGPVLGSLPAVSSAAQEMDAITARITPQMRQPGSGATSDFDAKMFRMATVGRTKNEGANQAIAQGIVANAQVAQDKEQFFRDYLTVNGHIDGAERKWKQYADANPIFDPKSPSEPKLNPARQSYREFFTRGAPAQTPAPVPTQTPSNRPVPAPGAPVGRGKPEAPGTSAPSTGGNVPAPGQGGGTKSRSLDDLLKQYGG